MNRQRVGVVTLAAVIGIGMSAQPAAATDLTAGKAVLDMLCRDKGGQPYFTPYTISRCQEARNKRGFEIEEALCEDVLNGTFSVAAVPMRQNRSNWACVSGPVGQ
jgi:hypothetical protein